MEQVRADQRGLLQEGLALSTIDELVHCAEAHASAFDPASNPQTPRPQRKLGTREVILIHHTNCGLLTFTEDEFRQELLEETGIKPAWSAEAFTDMDADVRSSMKRITSSPFVPHRDNVRGFVYDVETGVLREVAGA